MRLSNSANTTAGAAKRAFTGRGSAPYTQLALAAAIASSLTALPAMAQPAKKQGAAALMEEVVVTARKREEQAQDIPLQVSAYGADQLSALKVRSLESLSVGMPNVSLDDTGTAKGYANFSIRGLGINSSILSIDPTVGVFVDGVYMAVSSGMVFDMFDLQRVEVLRGPQGTLFGRNVTGGAILITTKKPGDHFEGSAKTAVEGGGPGGLNKYLMGTAGGPITDTFGGKITAYYNHDDGWFKNKYDGKDFGKNDQKMARAVGVWKPRDSTEIVLRWEHDINNSDGPPAQNHRNGSGVAAQFGPNFKRNSFDISLDQPGYYNTDTDFVTLEVNQDVGFGNGTITNIAGWRQFDGYSLGDIDSQPAWLFNSQTWTKQHQVSDELRYSGRFVDRANVTTGIFYMKNDLGYNERRLFGPDLLGLPVTFDGGGIYSVETWSAYAAVDYDLTDALTLNLGVGYTYETKDAKIASLGSNIAVNNAPTCNIVNPGPGDASGCNYDFKDSKNWGDFSPKVGVTYELSDQARVYAQWSKSFRSGGYNLRNAALPSDTIPAPFNQENPADIPGPFNKETVDNYEIGLKSEYGRSRLNAAIFYTEIKNMQRELNFPGALGVIQLVRNTADAAILGFEFDGAYELMDNLVLTASAGWLDAEYTKVVADLNGDGLINNADKKLDLPRAPKLTYSVGLNHDLSLGAWGYMASRISYAFRDNSAYTDDNRGYIDSQHILNAGIDFHTADEDWVFGIYGNNLLGDVKQGGDTQLPDSIGGTFSPLAKGRVVGVQATYNF